MASDRVRIHLQPLGESFETPRGTPLRDLLFAYGVEFPCGGRGRCRRCRVRVLAGSLPVTPEEAGVLAAEELEQGWRLACHARAAGDLTLEIAQWEAAILADSSIFEFTPSEGLGVAVDLGTTTLVAQLIDLATAHVLAVRTTLNPQAVHGGDIMSRIQFAVEEKGQARLERLVRERVGQLVSELTAAAHMDDAALREVVIVGNTAMHHLFCGVDVEPLSHVPFDPVCDGLKEFRASQLGWRAAGDPVVRFLPCLGGFVGSDILAGMLATKMHEQEELIGLIDLGTNAEIVFGNRERIACASAAAGPAFEGGRITAGMRAATGAIAEVALEDGRLRCHVLGDAAPRGICGSGLVDAVAAGLELGAVKPSGRLPGAPFPVCPPVCLTQADIRELQLAKGAVAAGIRIVLRRLGSSEADVGRVYLAGAFGNYVNRGSARRIGLIDFPDEVVQPAGNTALLGAKLALFAPDRQFAPLRARASHSSLASDPEFQEIFVQEMAFPP